MPRKKRAPAVDDIADDIAEDEADFVDVEEKPDSIKHHEQRKAKIEAENQQNAEDKEIANFKGLPREGETRDQLLDRIRKMRDEKPAAVESEGYRSEAQMKTFTAEQEAGRAAVAKAQAERDRLAAAQAEFEKGEKNKAG